ncbi:toxin ParE1/3/4 [Microbacterium sp. W4I4]|uniref:type II toxin-antitoxin system RelE/ParE family toxin n=1 Tax=Microbacterium sp. W4I4 TaxID=3042295 RepID=UPI00278A0A19|nr:toxin ParE1/3/4 [Microbacterium sp. W4I4]
MSYEVLYSPEARQQLTELYGWIAEQSGFPDRAEAFVTDILDFCDGLARHPYIGISREDIRPTLRTVGFRRRVIIAFAIAPTSIQVHGVYYGGRDHDALLAALPE